MPLFVLLKFMYMYRYVFICKCISYVTPKKLVIRVVSGRVLGWLRDFTLDSICRTEKERKREGREKKRKGRNVINIPKPSWEDFAQR